MQNPFKDFQYWPLIAITVSVLVIGYILGKVL